MVLEEMVSEHDLLTKMETIELYELGVWDMWYVLTVSALGKGGWRLELKVSMDYVRLPRNHPNS